MSSYTFERIKGYHDIRLTLDSCENGIYKKSEITINYERKIATLFYPSGNGINNVEYFTNSQNINRPTTKIINIYILTILKNKLYNQFIDDNFMRFNYKPTDMYKNIVYDCVSVDQQINRYFRLLDEWYEDIEKLTKIPRYIWFKVIDDELSINYTDFNYVDCKKYILSHKNLEIGDYSTLNYECGEIYGEHPFNEITSTKLPFNEYLSIKNKFPNFFRERNFRMNPSYGLVKMYFTKQTGILFFPQEIGWKRFDPRKEQRSIARPIVVPSATSS
jgi:hypothetical protein